MGSFGIGRAGFDIFDGLFASGYFLEELCVLFRSELDAGEKAR